MGSARRATRDDAETLAALVDQALAATANRRGGNLLSHVERSRTSMSRVTEALDKPGRVALAGEFEGVVFGVALLHTEPSNAGPIAVINELWVDPEAREVGIGEALVAAAVDWANQRGAVGIDVEVLPGDREMKNLCERCGLVARTLTMYRNLAGQPTNRAEEDPSR